MSEKVTNYFKLGIMVSEATKTCQELLKSEWKKIYNRSINKDDIRKLIVNSNIELKRKQQVSVERGDINDFDLTLVTTIFLNSNGFKKQSKENKKWVQKLVEIRNIFAHSVDLIITDSEFEKLYNDFCTSMRSIGYHDEEKLKSFKTYNISIHKNHDDKIFTNKDLLKFKNLANKELADKNYLKAIEWFTKCMISFNLSDKEMAEMYFQRSLCYYEYYESSINPDSIDLQRSLADAEKILIRDPSWLDGYLRCAETYEKLNEQTKAKEFYQKALALDIKNEKIKNKLAFVTKIIGEQERLEHLNQDYMPFSSEKRNEMIFEKKFKETGINNKSLRDDKTIKMLTEMIAKKDPSFLDVCLAHEYRDGSKNYKQNYDLAAKYYSKAAADKNPEAMYNLALLHMKGLGVKVDFRLAISLLKQAAEQPPYRKIEKTFQEIPNIGVAESLHSLGNAYQEGVFVEKNYPKAVEYYEKAVKLNSPHSANNLGLMYLNGMGTIRNIEKAESLFHLSHKLGNKECLSNLVLLYLEMRDPDRAELWLNNAIKEKCQFSISIEDEMRKNIASLKKSKSSYDIASKSVKENIKKLTDAFDKINCTVPSYFLPKEIRKKIDVNTLNQLKDSSMKGSLSAINFLNALSLNQKSLKMLKEKDNFNVNDFVKTLSEAYQTEQIACSIPEENYERIIQLLEDSIITDMKSKSDLDCHARVCHLYLKPNVDFASNCISKYPEFIHFRKIRAHLLCFDSKWSQSLDDFNFILDKKPNNIEELYFKAAILRNIPNKSAESIKFYKLFLSKIHNDHRKVPEAYYSLASLCLTENRSSEQNVENVNKNIKEYFEKGLESEKNQLSIFMPYKSSQKELLQISYDLIMNKPTNPTKSDEDEYSKYNKKLEFIRNDFRRINMINEYRQNLMNLKKFDQNCSNENLHKVYNSFKPSKNQKSSNSLVGLKQIYLKDIDFTKDHILNGYVLQVNIIELPTTLVSTQFLVEDEFGYVERMFLYNFKLNNDAMGKMFPIGCSISIINPYARIAADTKPAIRVDDPKSIVFNNDLNESICRFCMKAGSKYQCSSCSKAKYCSKQCQIDDWKILNHKLICFK